MAKNSSASGAFKNALLAKASRKLLEDLQLELTEMPVDLVLYEPNETIRHAYFPERGCVSVMSSMVQGGNIEVGTVGREGMLGSVLLLETTTVPHRHFVQVAGHAYRIAASALMRAADTHPTLRRDILRYEARSRTHFMQGMACNGLHNIEQRCCRWLLMTRDRVDSDDLELSHKFLAMMLGVRRASVTDVLTPLQSAGLVRCKRGTISLLDRKRLEARVCECYRIMASPAA
jgi:CRP-like cAMP-binding protein